VTRARAMLVVLAAGGLGCGSDAPSGPLTLDECRALEREWEDGLAGLDYACGGPADCTLVGAPAGPCDGYPAIGACGGSAVNLSSFTAAGLDAVLYRYRDGGCLEVASPIWDCPSYRADCIDGGCRAVEAQACF
jgi:hypothetical protein